MLVTGIGLVKEGAAVWMGVVEEGSGSSCVGDRHGSGGGSGDRKSH